MAGWRDVSERLRGDGYPDLAGEVDRAVATFERAVSAINDVGLLAEEIDADGDMIGNFPQAFSHIGLVNAAWAIAQAQQRRS